MSRDKMTTTSVHLNDHSQCVCVQQRFRVEVMTTAEKNDDCWNCINSSSGEHPGRATETGPCAEDRVDSQIQYQRCRRFRRPKRFHKCGSWTRLASRQKIVETTQMQFLGKVIDIPVVVQHQVSMVQVVQKQRGRSLQVDNYRMNFKANASSYSSVQTAAESRSRCVHDVTTRS